MSYIFYLHTPLCRSHNYRHLFCTVKNNTKIEFIFDVCALFNVYFLNKFSFWPCLVRHKCHTKDLRCQLSYLFKRTCKLNTATKSTSTSVNLSFYNPNISTKFRCISHCLIWCICNNTSWCRNTIFSKNLFCLIFMYIHLFLPFKFNYSFGLIISSGTTYLSNSSEVNKPSLTASSFRVVPFLCAVFAILAAFSYPI